MTVGLTLFHYINIIHFGTERNCWWKNNDPLFTDPSNWLYCEFSLSFLNFWFSDVLECMCNQSLCSEWFEWVFAVETGWLSRFSTFPFREHVCFKKWFKPLLEKIHFSADVDNWNGCFPQFDSHCSFLLAVMSALCDTVSIPLCPHKHLLGLLQSPVYSWSFIKCSFPRWPLPYVPRFAFCIKFSNLGFFDIKAWVLWEDTAERYQIKVYQSKRYQIYYSQWISLKM